MNSRWFFQSEAPTGMSGKELMQVPRTGTQAARVRSVVFVVFCDGAESERSSGDGTCQAPPSLMRSYCQLGVLETQNCVLDQCV